MRVLSLWKGEITVRHTKFMRDILAEVAERNDVTVADLKGPSRQRRCAWPRFEAMYLMHQAGHSLPEIGRFLGNRDHTTALHGCRRYAAWLLHGTA
jgi:chromosomal replication initiator protein